ncbi:hypothetical protein KP79_PYT03533 [Mizuhopecten yessoensis]|uniref:Uncharacterized protein n=1 Tax=Mizuhopecten yessoensis TaxID=6573 RepID=A0A210R3V0_MIZYE|nr:hypothetical protein KP79_PYT03533 [Mizuhopecten yessoensis]
MEFCKTYHSIREHDLRHIYSGDSYTRVIRTLSKLPVIPQQRHGYTSTSRRGKRELEYNYQYRIYVPRAPAFEVLSRKCVNQMVDRLHRPKTSNGNDYETRPKHVSFDSTHNRAVTSLTSADIKNCSERLANQQTVATEVRRCLTGCIRSKSPTPDLRSSCPRMTQSVSQRYYPRAYKRLNMSQTVEM